jgi:DNA adenine methylase
MRDPNWKKCVICADSRDILKRIPDNSIDFILTDPPYNLAPHSTGNIYLPGRSAMNNDVADWDNVEFNPEEWADEFIRVLKPTGNLFIFTSYNQLGRWYNCLDSKFDSSNFMIWHKTNPAPKIFKAGFLNSCEMIFTCWNKKHTWNFISQREMHNFIESPICMSPERLTNPKHPTQKPISILKKMIEIASNKDDIIFDPFMGVGSSGVAALQLDRKFIGVELNVQYFNAAKDRIENVLNEKNTEINMRKSKLYDNGKPIIDAVGENTQPYQLTLEGFDDLDILDNCFHLNTGNKGFNEDISTKLSPIIKWPGGKEKELKYIIPNTPRFDRFYEPFVGGGSVFMGVKANEYYINDFSTELIDLYQCIATSNEQFIEYVQAMNDSWINAANFFYSNETIVDTFVGYRKGLIGKEELKQFVEAFCKNNEDKIYKIIGSKFSKLPCVLIKEVKTNLFRKMVRMRELEIEKHELPKKDLYDNIETAIKSAVYMNYRHLYNDKEIAKDRILHCALFFFMRNYAYSGMFRYSSKGDFNVPYGGIAYNSKQLTKKLSYYQSDDVKEHFSKTNIFNLDFEEFLRRTNPKENDFVFLDPPYDSEFSTYAQNAFTKEDQTRLANYMINKCRAKWMMIIKNTDFIYNLYNRAGINIRTFDKEYLVSFMNRNDKKVTHLLITNY